MTSPVFSDEFRRELETLLRWRRDVRRFQDRPVEPDMLRHLIDLSASAPSVGYSQPARFVLVSDPGRRAAIVAEYERCNSEALSNYSGEKSRLYASLKLAGLREAPVQLATFADETTARGSGLGRVQMPETLAYSAVTALQTLALAARAHGLGVGWVSILDPARVTAIVEVDPRWRFIAYLCVGYPVEEHDDRELVRAGWEADDPASARLIER
ncbi:MAG TPA: 5,6-dimethylbenzimidazole synthase [Candidatus Lustribacter sp.]|jgi:5,6-dimethylbenzimidazole synthase|nr:5,6-dimethylbenzimidazole synthase [Candidatus Lustribacter sp.]